MLITYGDNQVSPEKRQPLYSSNEIIHNIRKNKKITNEIEIIMSSFLPITKAIKNY